MEFNKVSKIDNAHTLQVQIRAGVMFFAHKFVVNVIDVFGLGTKLMSIHEKFADVENLKWVTPPYENMYIELLHPQDLKKFQQVVAFSISYDKSSGVMQAFPVLIQDNELLITSLVYTIGIKRPLTPEDCMMENKPTTWREGLICNGRVFAAKQLNSPFVEITEDFTRYLIELLETLLYINAKGVGTTTHVPPTKVNAKRVKRGANPLHEFKTLRIIKKNERRDVINTNWGVIPSFWSTDRREHTVRGHMAIYTEERPLFGNPKNVGPIWISPHIRCKGTEGGITKNYIVE